MSCSGVGIELELRMLLQGVYGTSFLDLDMDLEGGYWKECFGMSFLDLDMDWEGGYCKEFMEPVFWIRIRTWIWSFGFMVQDNPSDWELCESNWNMIDKQHDLAQPRELTVVTCIDPIMISATSPWTTTKAAAPT